MEQEIEPPPPPPAAHVSVKFPPPLSTSVGDVQLLMEIDAACAGVEAGTARRTAVTAAAAEAHAAGRTSVRIIFDSQAEGRSGGPDRTPATSAPTITMKTINYRSCKLAAPRLFLFRSSEPTRRD